MSSHNHQLRPSSAIYLGSSTAGTEEVPRPTASTPGTPHLVSSGRPAQLPSPPHTNSTSGSTGDKDSANAGSVRRSRAPLPAHEEGVEHTGMQNTTEFIHDEDDDDQTRRQTQILAPSADARERRVAPKLDKSRTLAERNREILDKLDRFGTLGRTRTPSTGLSPLPRTASLGRSMGGMSNPAFTPSPMRHASLSLPRDRESDVFDSDAGSNIYHEADDRSKTPPASSPAKRLNELSPRQRLVSEPTSPDRLGLLRNAAGSQRRATPMSRRELSTVEERSPANSSAKKRTPIPFEFLNEQANSSGYADSENGSSNALVPRPSSHSRQPSPGLYTSEGSPSLGTSSATLASASFSSPTGSRRPRPAGLRNSYDRWGESYDRWEASQTQAEETASPRGDGDSSPTKRMGVRSVVNESLKAAGLTRRNDDPSRTRTLSDALALRAGSLVNSPSTHVRREWDSVDLLRDEPPRTAIIKDRSSSRMSDARGSHENQRDSSVRGSLMSPGIRASRTIHNVLNSQDYDDANGRETPANLRQFKSTYTGSASSASMGKAYTSPSGTQRYLPSRSTTVTNLSSPFIGQTNSGGSSSGNLVQLLQDALFMFESHVQKLPQSSTMPDTYNDVLRDAKGIVNAATALNVALKSAATICVDEQIEAEVEAAAGPAQHDDEERNESGQAADVWRKVGAEFREDTRVADELVRALTSFMIGTGRMLRSAASTGHSRMLSVDGGSISRAGAGSMSRATSLHRGEHGGAGSSDGRRSVEGWSRGVGLSTNIDRRSTDGRLSVDGRRMTDGRRSVEPPAFLGSNKSSDEHRDETMRRLTGRNPPRNPDDAASNGSGGGGSAGSGSRLANRSNRASFQAQGGDPSRPNTSLSMIRDVPRASRETSPVKTFTALSSRRSVGIRTPAMGSQKDLPTLPMPDNRGELSFPQTEDGGDRTPMEASRPHIRHSTMPPLAVPPPLPTLPSESLLQNGRTPSRHAPSHSVTSASTNSTTTLGRGTSVAGGHATVRRSAIIPSSSSTTRTTAVSPVTARPRQISQSSVNSPLSLSRARATTAISELQQVASADLTRKRTLSITDDEGLPRASLPDSPSLPVTSSTTSSTSYSKSSAGSPSINGGTARRSALSNLGVSPSAESRRPPIKPLNRRTSSTLSGSGAISPSVNSPTSASKNRIVSRTASSSALTSPVSATGTSSASRSFYDAGIDSADARSGTEEDKKLRRSKVRMSLNAVIDRRGGLGELLGRSRLSRARDDEERVDLSDSPSHSAAERRRRAAEQLQ